MNDLDLKDRKILYHLDLNSRQSFSKIGRKIGLHKDSVSDRVKKLQDQGIILRYTTLTDELKLGFSVMRISINFQNITLEKRDEIIDHFVKYEYSEVVATTEGSIDLNILMSTLNGSEIYPFWQKTLSKYNDYFEKYTTSTYIGENIYPKSFLINEKKDRNNIIVRGGLLTYIDELDHDILKEISKNSRIPTIELAKKFDKTSITINKSINRLINLGIILRFSITVDWQKIGYSWFKLDLFLKEYEKLQTVKKYVEMNPNLAYIDKSLGYADLELEYIVKNMNQLRIIIEDLYTKFPKVIRNYSYFEIIKNHKWINIPQS
jgi:Lrp/AsnC family leucine-responsive transcriptional regulator